MNFFVIGGSGFLGRYVIHALLKEDNVNKIYCLVHDKEIPLENEKIVKIKGSIEALDNVRVDDKIHQCIVLSGITDGVDIDDQIIIKVNYTGVKSAVAFCKKKRIDHICIVSSVNVKLDRQGSYAKSKWKAEKVVKESGLGYLIFRPALIYGQNCKKGLKVIEDFIMKYGIVPVFGNGQKLEQPIWVGECAALIVYYLLANSWNRTIELYGRDAMTYNQMCHLIAKTKGKQVKLIHVPVWLCELGLCISESLHIKIPVSREQIYHVDTDLVGDMGMVYHETGVYGDSFFNNLMKRGNVMQ